VVCRKIEPQAEKSGENGREIQAKNQARNQRDRIVKVRNRMILQPLGNRAGRLSVVFSLMLMLLLAGCGFHLRGQYMVPDFLKEVTLHVPPNSGSFQTEMRLALERNNILPDGGEVTIDIIRESLMRQTPTIDNSVQAVEYTLVYSVDYSVGLLGKKTISPRQSIILRRSYQYNNVNVVGKSTEESTLESELRTDAAQQIVRQIVSMKQPPQVIPDDTTKAGAKDSVKDSAKDGAPKLSP
jgi:LPS-assembly lipoprotein